MWWGPLARWATTPEKIDLAVAVAHDVGAGCGQIEWVDGEPIWCPHTPLVVDGVRITREYVTVSHGTSIKVKEP